MKSICAQNLNLVKPALPNVALALEAKREATFDELKRLFERNIRSWCQQEMDVIRHDHKCMQCVPTLAAVMLQHVEEKIRRRFYLEESATVRHNRSYEVRASFLRRESHRTSI